MLDGSSRIARKRLKEIVKRGHKNGSTVERVHAKHKQNKQENYLAEELESILEKLKEERRKKKKHRKKQKAKEHGKHHKNTG